MTKCDGKKCENSPKFRIIYDGGESPDQELTLCQKHYDSNEVFRKYILKIVEIGT